MLQSRKYNTTKPIKFANRGLRKGHSPPTRVTTKEIFLGSNIKIKIEQEQNNEKLEMHKLQ